MTQAYNLAILANAVNTSGQLNVGTNATGTLPVANGGTGSSSLTANNVLLGNGTSAVQAVAPSTAGNILTSNGSTWVSQAPSGGGVTSLNGQTGAITNTNSGVIGSYTVGGIFASFGTYAPGTTVSGSSLRNPGSQGNQWYDASANPMNPVGNQGPVYNPGYGGTWRSMAYCRNNGQNPDDGQISGNPNIWVRIS